MDFQAHRPQRGFGRSERALAKIAEDLTRFLTKAQRSLTYETLHLSGRQRETLASLLVEFAEDLSQDIGLWSSLEAYNRDFFGTPLPCVLQPDDEMDAEPINPSRVQFLLWTLYAALEPELILAPTHQDFERLALWIAAFLAERFAHRRYDSGVKTFLRTPNTYGWDVKRKLVWLGQHAYLFRLHCEAYIRDHGGKADIPTLDDFVCQETTSWSGVGVIDILAATVDMTEDQRRDLRRWSARHTAYFRVVSLREPFMDVINLLNEQPYTTHMGKIGTPSQGQDVVFGSLVPWEGVWYWSGVQHRYTAVTDEEIQRLTQDLYQKAPQIVYRYCPSLAEQARESTRKEYQTFVDYYGNELVVYPDGYTMAAAMQKFYEQRLASAPKDVVDAFVKKHHLATPSPHLSYPPELLESTKGIGVYFYPEEGIEIMNAFHEVISGFTKQGRDVTAAEAERLQGVMQSQAISPQFMRKLVQAYGDASLASVFLIPETTHKVYVEYLLRRYKGHFYRQRYPTLTLV